MKITVNRKLEREIFKVLRVIPHGKLQQPLRQNKLRSSSLPYCGLHMALTDLELIKDKQTTPSTLVERELVLFKDGFYFSVGNALHLLWQASGAHHLPGNLVGDWYCSRQLEEPKVKNNVRMTYKCGHKAEFCTQNDAVLKVCPHGKKNCQEHFRYSEINLQYKHLGGHPDFLYRKGRNYHIIDFKTTSTFLFEKTKLAIKMGYYPSKKYIEQLEAYCFLLEKLKNVRVKSYTIAYIGRDAAVDRKTGIPRLKLFTYRYNKKRGREIEQKLKTYDKRWQNYTAWLQSFKSKKAYSQASKNLYDNRPCHSRRQYLETMEAAFFDPCPWHENGACYSGKSLKLLNKGRPTGDKK